MVRLSEVIAYLDTRLEISRFRDYGPNGLQVEGSPDIRRIATGVSANAALIERAVAAGADLIVVHHGLIWGAGLASITGPTARRLGALLANRISLAAYHLPLDAHPQLGNNAGLADALGLLPERQAFGDVRGIPLGLAGRWAQPLGRDAAIERIATALGCPEPPFLFAHGPARVRNIGLCTGAASDLVEAAASAGCDLFLTGELAERAGELARELELTLVAAGHYRTETFGPQRIAADLAARWPGVEVEFIPVPNPL
jgi:dinuclear metal center YbgI/SA1388 family protein